MACIVSNQWFRDKFAWVSSKRPSRSLVASIRLHYVWEDR